MHSEGWIKVRKNYGLTRKHTRKWAPSRSKNDKKGVSTYNSYRCVFHACCREFIHVPEINIRNFRKLNVQQRAARIIQQLWKSNKKINFHKLATPIAPNPPHPPITRHLLPPIAVWWWQPAGGWVSRGLGSVLTRFFFEFPYEFRIKIILLTGANYFNAELSQSNSSYARVSCA